MSKSIYLDPEKTALLEPFEGDIHNGSWISPFGVPRRILVWNSSIDGLFRTIRFEYSGGESGSLRASLDEETSPSIQILSGHLSGKIIELNFDPPINEGSFPFVAERLRRRSSGFKVLASKFNYLMIASIFDRWSELVGS